MIREARREESFRDVLEAMSVNEYAHFLLRTRWHALEFDDPDLLLMSLALVRLWRYNDALKILNSSKTLRYIAECRRAWIKEDQQRGQSAAAGFEARRCQFLGELYSCKGNFAAAIRWYFRALQWRRKEAHWESGAPASDSVAYLHDKLGECHWRLGLFRQARSSVRQCFSHPNWRQQAFDFMGIIYRSEGLFNRAAHYFRLADATEDLHDILEARALAELPTRESLWTLGGPVAWVVGGSRFLKKNPDDWEVFFKLCSQWSRLFRFDKTLSLIRAAERRAKSQKEQWLLVRLWAEKGTTYLNQGQYRVASRWFRQTSDFEPSNADHLTSQGICEARLGNLNEAERLLRQAILRDSGCKGKAWYNLGLVLRSTESFKEAADCFTSALQLDPTNDRARLALVDVRKALDFQDLVSKSC